MSDVPDTPPKTIFDGMKLEISVSIEPNLFFEGEDNHEIKLIFIRPRKLRKLKDDKGILGEFLRGLIERFD